MHIIQMLQPQPPSSIWIKGHSCEESFHYSDSDEGTANMVLNYSPIFNYWFSSEDRLVFKVFLASNDYRFLSCDPYGSEELSFTIEKRYYRPGDLEALIDVDTIYKRVVGRRGLQLELELPQVEITTKKISRVMKDKPEEIFDCLGAQRSKDPMLICFFNSRILKSIKMETQDRNQSVAYSIFSSVQKQKVPAIIPPASNGKSHSD